MLSVYEMAKDVLTWAWAHKRTAGEILMVLVILVGGWRHNKLQAELRKDKAEASALADGLRQQITVANNRIQILTRDSSGKTVYKEVYVPPEGSVTISEKDRDALQQKVADLTKKLGDAVARGDGKAADAIRGEIGKVSDAVTYDVHYYGFTFKPGLGFSWSNKGISPKLDFKWAYWERWGLEAGGSKNGLGISLSRHIDDVMWGHPTNIEPFVGWDFLTFGPGNKQGELGIRANF